MTTVDPRPDTAVASTAEAPTLLLHKDTAPTGTPAPPADPPATSARAPWDPYTIAGAALGLVVVLLAGFVGYLATVSDIQQARTQRRLYDQISDDFYRDTGPLGGAIEEGTPVALLEIPALDVKQVVVEGTTAALLRGGPGHLRNTALPGGYGNAVLMGKSWTYGAPFGRIGDLRPGQKIKVTTQQGEFTYLVRGQKHVGNGHDDAIAPGGANQLTLVTADSWFHPGGRDTVVADLQGKAERAEPGRPKTVRSDEKGTSGESGAGVALLLWAQALVAVTAALAWALRRYDRRVTLLLGTPTAIAVLWALYDTAARLLPATV
ncbi:sortase [Yinghuangia seranimata]|uniref:sortase n=1 Tax=Yinghuangia seranimata TaxID=408067 RepID=UPI00248BD0C1|nr:class E sortase [Yinghuangia seranimata]MDI2132873.1 class E sortase [Yinghuangia seranimata]